MMTNKQPRPHESYASHTDTEIKGFFEEYRYLSNFTACPVWYEGILYPSTENAYQAAKCFIIEDRPRFVAITPSESKRLGNLVPLRDDWEKVKFDVMSSVVFQKFLQHPHLRERLLATGNKYLEETNHWGDRIWGVCNGVGTNWLGQILMRTRAFFQPLPPIPPSYRMSKKDFLDWVCANQPDPWSMMAYDIIQWDNEAQLKVLCSRFNVTLE